MPTTKNAIEATLTRYYDDCVTAIKSGDSERLKAILKNYLAEFDQFIFLEKEKKFLHLFHMRSPSLFELVMGNPEEKSEYDKIPVKTRESMIMSLADALISQYKSTYEKCPAIFNEFRPKKVEVPLKREMLFAQYKELLFSDVSYAVKTNNFTFIVLLCKAIGNHNARIGKTPAQLPKQEDACFQHDSLMTELRKQVTSTSFKNKEKLKDYQDMLKLLNPYDQYTLIFQFQHGHFQLAKTLMDLDFKCCRFLALFAISSFIQCNEYQENRAIIREFYSKYKNNLVLSESDGNVASLDRILNTAIKMNPLGLKDLLELHESFRKLVQNDKKLQYLSLAIRGNHADSAMILLNYCDFSCINENRLLRKPHSPLLKVAASQGQFEVVKVLVEKGAIITDETIKNHSKNHPHVREYLSLVHFIQKALKSAKWHNKAFGKLTLNSLSNEDKKQVYQLFISHYENTLKDSKNKKFKLIEKLTELFGHSVLESMNVESTLSVQKILQLPTPSMQPESKNPAPLKLAEQDSSAKSGDVVAEPLLQQDQCFSDRAMSYKAGFS